VVHSSCCPTFSCVAMWVLVFSYPQGHVCVAYMIVCSQFPVGILHFLAVRFCVQWAMHECHLSRFRIPFLYCMPFFTLLIILLKACFSCVLCSYADHMCLLLCSSVILVQSSSSTRSNSTLGTVMFCSFRMLPFLCCLYYVVFVVYV
jgi:hypothetical protein